MRAIHRRSGRRSLHQCPRALHLRAQELNALQENGKLRGRVAYALLRTLEIPLQPGVQRVARFDGRSADGSTFDRYDRCTEQAATILDLDAASRRTCGRAVARM